MNRKISHSNSINITILVLIFSKNTSIEYEKGRQECKNTSIKYEKGRQEDIRKGLSARLFYFWNY